MFLLKLEPQRRTAYRVEHQQDDHDGKWSNTMHVQILNNICVFQLHQTQHLNLPAASWGWANGV